MPATMPDLAILNDLDADVCSHLWRDSKPVHRPVSPAQCSMSCRSARPTTWRTPSPALGSRSSAWARAGFAARRAVLLRAHDLILERREDTARHPAVRDGQDPRSGIRGGLPDGQRHPLQRPRRAPALRGGRRRSALPLIVDTTVRYRPKGVVGVITPWNFPLSLAAMDVVPALAAGCGVVQKADDQGALSVLALRRAFIDAGLPPELWAVVDRRRRRDRRCRHGPRRLHLLHRLDRHRTQRRRRRPAERLVGASLELGGKNAMIVLDDVDPVKAAADAAYACFSSCRPALRLDRAHLRPARRRPAFTAAFAARVAVLRAGLDLRLLGTDVGSLTSAAQLARVQAHVEDAVAKGATVLAGGQARPDLGPFFFEPTVLTEVTSEMDCASPARPSVPSSRSTRSTPTTRR